MRKFVILRTYREEREIAIPVEDIEGIESKKDDEGKVYTKVIYGTSGWVKAKESVSEIVEKIHSLGESEDKV